MTLSTNPDASDIMPERDCVRKLRRRAQGRGKSVMEEVKIWAVYAAIGID